MKALKTLTTGFFALALASLAPAQVVLHITGSTAFRAATLTAIGNILNSGYTLGYNGTSITGASQSVYQGTTKSGNISVIIKTSWSGSVGGLQTVAQLSPALTVANWLQTGLSGSGLNTGPYDSASSADVTMSDSFQATTAFTGSGYATLTDNIVGVVGFVWVKGQTNDSTVSPSLASLTNVDPLIARALLTAGTVPLSMFTGNSADSSVDVDIIGRDEDSGTRVAAFSETGFGVFAAPYQYQPTIAGGVVTSIAPWPQNTVNGITYTQLGHSGYSSGGLVASSLNTPVNTGATDPFSNKFVLISYPGISDAVNVNGGNNELTWNGVPYSAANIQQGKYTFWTYEHMMYRNTLSAPQQQIAQLIANQIITQDAAVSGVTLGSMQVSRTIEGGVVTHN